MGGGGGGGGGGPGLTGIRRRRDRDKKSVFHFQRPRDFFPEKPVEGIFPNLLQKNPEEDVAEVAVQPLIGDRHLQRFRGDLFDVVLPGLTPPDEFRVFPRDLLEVGSPGRQTRGVLQEMADGDFLLVTPGELLQVFRGGGVEGELSLPETGEIGRASCRERV